MPISTINQNGLTNPLTSVAANTVTSAAATALTLQSAGTTAVTITTAQNVGIGTSSPTDNLYISRATNAAGGISVVNTNNAQASQIAQLYLQGGDNAYAQIKLQANSVNSSIRGNNDGSLAFLSSTTERMRIDSSGNVGIGTTSPNKISGTTILSVNTATAANYAGLDISTADAVRTALYANNSGSYLETRTSTPLVFGTNTTERMRIDSSGNVSMGHTAYDYSVNGFGFGAGNAYSYFTRTSGFALGVNRKTTTGDLMAWWYNQSGVGTVSTNGSSTSYNTTSDYRLKENVAPMVGALTTVSQLKPVTYTWKSTGEDSQGFIAHELAEVIPDCVNGEKDAVDAEGNPIYQGIDTSFLVATLTAAIQELKAEFDAYKASHP